MHAGLGAAVEESFSMEKIGKPAPFAKRAKDAALGTSKTKGSATRPDCFSGRWLGCYCPQSGLECIQKVNKVTAERHRPYAVR
jgi:hypothetical protein